VEDNMSVEYRLVPTKNNRARVVSRVDERAYVTEVVGREDGADFALESTRKGTKLFVTVPGAGQVILNGRQIRTLARVLNRHFA
jgi:hypothetical protein